MGKVALIVDDDSASREVVGLYFSSLGFDVSQAANGKEAFDILKKDHVDIVFLDLAMPEMTGEELMAKMVDDPVLKKVPIIIDTAQGFGTGRLAKVEKEYSGRMRFVGFTRPGSLKNLKETVTTLLMAA